jgi:hypothetical protein
MSHIYAKTKYKEEVPAYGSCYEEEHTLIVHHNHSCDITSFYDEKGNCVLSYGYTVDNNIFDAMNRLTFPFKKEWNGELLDDVERLTKEDHEMMDNRHYNRPRIITEETLVVLALNKGGLFSLIDAIDELFPDKKEQRLWSAAT